MNDLGADARLLEQVVNDLGRSVASTDGDADFLARAREIVEGAHAALQIVRSALSDKLGEAMGEQAIIVEGIGQVKRHKHKSRTRWDKDDLLRAVLDSRIVDPETGEVRDESPLDRVLAVWNLPAPRVTALRERGIDADEFCHTEIREGWAIEVSRDAADAVAPLIERARGALPRLTTPPVGDGADQSGTAPSPASTR